MLATSTLEIRQKVLGASGQAVSVARGRMVRGRRGVLAFLFEGRLMSQDNLQRFAPRSWRMPQRKTICLILGLQRLKRWLHAFRHSSV